MQNGEKCMLYKIKKTVATMPPRQAFRDFMTPNKRFEHIC